MNEPELTRYGFFSLQHAKKILDPFADGFDRNCYGNLVVWRTNEGKEVILTITSFFPDGPTYMYDDKVMVGVVTDFIRTASMEDCVNAYPELGSFVKNTRFVWLKKQDGLYVNINPLLSKFNKK